MCALAGENVFEHFHKTISERLSQTKVIIYCLYSFAIEAALSYVSDTQTHSVFLVVAVVVFSLHSNHIVEMIIMSPQM